MNVMCITCGSAWSWIICCRFYGLWKRRMSYSAVLQCLIPAACCSLERQLAASDQWNFHWQFPENGWTIMDMGHRLSRSVI